MAGTRYPHPLAVRVSQVPLRVDVVAHELFQLLGFGKAALHRPVPNKRVVDMHLKDAAAAGNERDFTQVLPESAEEFLGVPARPQKPAALHAEVDLDSRAWHFSSLAARFPGLLNFRDIQISANFTGQEVIDVAVPWQGRAFARLAVDVNRVVAAFPQERAAVCFQMFDEVAPLHSASSDGKLKGFAQNVGIE